ncbi:ABC transporter substrate-binding protein [Moraxella nasovis]|uniref:ABC transporter substrate-binding protein n=1 Tax=Moraxella nasovis TaxID=2904121 RepID=UPI001F61965D|nr:ABC transporter substrate-binding protein [Moraxella nasovis]UNU73175.1 ABC transporter substrate-binding protein [Moraxella nasovis]
MKTPFFKLTTLATIVAGAVGLTACGGGDKTTTDSGSANGSKTLVYCSEGSPGGFDHAQFTDGTSFDASAHTLFNGLVEFKIGTTELEPSLAEKWDISEDGLTYTFHLRPGVKFHTTDYFTPSRDFNADDVVFTLKRLTDKDLPFNKAYPAEFPYASDMALPELIKSVEKVDDHTVKVVLNDVNATFLSNLAMPFAYIHSAEYADKLAADGKAANLNTEPVGTGPFILKSYQKDQQIRYVKHPDYWNKDIVHLDNLIFAITKDSGVRAQKMEAGECSVSRYNKVAEIEAAKKSGKINVESREGYNTGYMALNVEKPKLADARVRQALDLAIDKDAIIQAVYAGAGTRAAGLLPPSQWGVDTELKPSEFNTEKAKALLAEAGATDLEIDLWYMPVQRPYNPNAKLMAEMIQADWAKAGIKAKLVTYEWGEYLQRAKSGEPDAVLIGWTGDNGDPDNWLGNLLSCNGVGGSNYARYCNKAFDSLVVDARSITDQDERSKKYIEAQRIIAKDVPQIYLAHSVTDVLLAKNVKGFVLEPLGNTRFEGVSVE